MAANKKRREAVEEYNLSEHDEARRMLVRALAMITERRVTGKVELDVSRGTPALLRTREEEKTVK